MDRAVTHGQERRNRQRGWLLAGVVLGVVLVAWIAWSAWRQNLHAQATQAFAANTVRVLQAALELESAGSAMEAHHRGWLLTGREDFLQQRERDFMRGMVQAAALQRAIEDDPVQRPRAQAAQRALMVRHAFMLQTAQRAEAEGMEAAHAFFRRSGIGSFNEARDALAAVRMEAERRLRVREGKAAASALAFSRLLLLGTTAALSLLAVTTWLLWRQLHRNEGIRGELERSLSLQHAILDAAGYMIIAADIEGRITLMNREASRTLGYTPEEVIGHPVPPIHDPAEVRARGEARGLALPPPGDPIPFDLLVEIVHNQGEEAPWTYTTRDGRRFPVLLTVNTLRDSDGAVVGFVGMSRDVTAQREAEQALEAFSYSISHDLRAPLRHIDGYARMLREDAEAALDDAMKRYIDAISEGARHMGTLIDDLLAFARLGRKAMEPVRVDMTDLARHALVEAGGPRSSAEVHIAPLPDAWADPVLLRQVWVNLLSNALKYSAPRGFDARVHVSGERDGDRVRYTVADNGVGFDMRYADKLFGVFQRLHTHDEFEGTGVGLAIVQRVLARHGGRVWAEAEPGRGARFGFDLPSAAPDDAFDATPVADGASA